jgi:hypothetical protein
MDDDGNTPEQIIREAIDRHPGVQISGCRPGKRMSRADALGIAAFIESVAKDAEPRAGGRSRQ